MNFIAKQIPMLIGAMAMAVTGCSAGNAEDNQAEIGDEAAMYSDLISEENESESEILLTINGTELVVSWEDNESVEEILKLIEEGNITIITSQYGGFEQVGSLPESITRNDVQMTTTAGDIVLYSGNSIVVFYGSNSWSYTKLGHIENLSSAELKELLGEDRAEVTLSLSKTD
ncbi:MAG: hypothetical protein LUE88_08715 [Clostridiales bacterium]|nr:hypothetical protein [Clostridiales bacterium]